MVEGVQRDPDSHADGFEDAPGGGSARGVLLVLAAVVAVGLFVRSPLTRPADPPSVAPTPAQVVDPVTEEGRRLPRLPGRGGGWNTVGLRPPIRLFSPSPSVWTGHELVVGFTPDVAAFGPDRPLRQAWRSLPPHPGGALEVRGAVQAPGGPLYVYGSKECAGCGWQPTLYTLDLAAHDLGLDGPTTTEGAGPGVWRRHADAPGPVARRRAQVHLVGGRPVVVRDHGDRGLQALMYLPDSGVWRDLSIPLAGSVRWKAVPAGDQLVLTGIDRAADGSESRFALAYDASTAAANGADSNVADATAAVWRDISAGMPLRDPHNAAAAWTGHEVVFFGASSRGGFPRGASVSMADDTWRELGPLPVFDPLLPRLDTQGPLTGLAAVWDGNRVNFVGGLSDTLFVAWSPERQDWEVRWPARPRAGGNASWTGRQILLWGGVDRNGPVLDLQFWPARSVGS